MSTTNFGQGHATQAQEAPVRRSGDGYSLRSRSLDASATVGHRRPTPVRVPKGPESLLDPEIEFGHVTAQQINARQTGLFPTPTKNSNTTHTPPDAHTTKTTTQNLTLNPENLTSVKQNLYINVKSNIQPVRRKKQCTISTKSAEKLNVR